MNQSIAAIAISACLVMFAVGPTYAADDTSVGVHEDSGQSSKKALRLKLQTIQNVRRASDAVRRKAGARNY